MCSITGRGKALLRRQRVRLRLRRVHSLSRDPFDIRRNLHGSLRLKTYWPARFGISITMFQNGERNMRRHDYRTTLRIKRVGLARLRDDVRQLSGEGGSKSGKRRPRSPDGAASLHGIAAAQDAFERAKRFERKRIVHEKRDRTREPVQRLRGALPLRSIERGVE
jgi:hypothetical protein